MYRLIMDTALDYSYLALLKDGVLLKENYSKGANNHSETLLPELEAMLKEESIRLPEVSEVYVGIGPGSYTGVRIAVVIGKMIAVMNGIKLFSFSSLAGLSSSRKAESYAFVDFRRGNAYSAHFDYVDGSLVRLSGDAIVPVSEYFKDIPPEMVVKEGKPDPFLIISPSVSTAVPDANSLSPNYLQLVEAERKKQEEKNAARQS